MSIAKTANCHADCDISGMSVPVHVDVILETGQSLQDYMAPVPVVTGRGAGCVIARKGKDLIPRFKGGVLAPAPAEHHRQALETLNR